MNSLYPFFFIIAMISMTFIIDTAQVAFRLLSGVLGIPVIGAHLALVLMLANRVSTSAGLLLIAYLVDNSVLATKLAWCYFSAALIITGFNFYFLRWEKVIKHLTFFLRLVYGDLKTNEKLILKDNKNEQSDSPLFSKRTNIAITLIGYLGLLAPSILASRFNEHRATLMQCGFILNSISTVVQVLCIEKQMAFVINDGKRGAIFALYRQYVVSRGYGYFIAANAFFLYAITFIST